MGKVVQERKDCFRENRSKWQSLIYLSMDKKKGQDLVLKKSDFNKWHLKYQSHFKYQHLFRATHLKFQKFFFDK